MSPATGSTVLIESSGTDRARATEPIRTAEFFAGIGLVRKALEPLGVEVVWANDIERAKLSLYAANHSGDHFHLGDVRDVHAEHLPAMVELATSSFPCVDLSLAGNRLGLVGAQSGMFYEFTRVLRELNEDGQRHPRMVLLENVPGFATSHGGEDLRRALQQLHDLEYSCDVFAVNARHFVPQSRLRMFVVGIRKDKLPEAARRGGPPPSDTRPGWVLQAYERNRHLRMHYLDFPTLPVGPPDLSAVAETMGRDDPRWWDGERLAAFVDSLSVAQAGRLTSLRAGRSPSWRTAYRRTRKGVAVWEIRADGIAGCLRTTGGGSSKQALVEAGRGEVRVRWMTPLEYARLMGASTYLLPAGSSNQALFGFGDAVVVDVVRWIGEHYVRRVLRP